VPRENHGHPDAGTYYLLTVGFASFTSRVSFLFYSQQKKIMATGGAATTWDDLPSDLHAMIAAKVAKTSSTPLEGLRNLRATCKAACKAVSTPFVAKHVVVRSLHEMRWWESDIYVATIVWLSGASNPEACFLVGIWAICNKQASDGVLTLQRAVDAGYKAASYVLAMLHYKKGDHDIAYQYIRRLEGDEEAQDEWTNRESVGVRYIALRECLNATWTMATLPVPFVLPQATKQKCMCATASKLVCGSRASWYTPEVFCSEACRIKREYQGFSKSAPHYLSLY
jgi:hypothetical protein